MEFINKSVMITSKDLEIMGNKLEEIHNLSRRIKMLYDDISHMKIEFEMKLNNTTE